MRRSLNKNSKVRVSFFVSVFLSAIIMALLLPACGNGPEGNRGITLKLVSCWEDTSILNDKLKLYIERVNEEGEGKVSIDYLGGPEIAPITEAVGLVRDGVYDMAMSTPRYYDELCPPANMLYYLTPDIALLREIGAIDISDEFHREMLGVSHLGFLTRGEKYTILSIEAITDANFSGLMIHTFPMCTASLSYLGASTKSIKESDYYTALQTGVVDAITLPVGTTPYELGLYEIADLILYPLIPIYETGVLLINAESFDGLPADVRELLTDVMLDIEKEVQKYYTEVMYTYTERLISKGIEPVYLLGDDADKYLYAFTDYAWERLLEKNPVWGPELYEVCKPYLEQ